MRCDDACTIAGLTETIDSIIKIDLPKAFASIEERNRLNLILFKAYYDRGVLHAKCGDFHVAIHDFGQAINRSKNSYLYDAYDRRAELQKMVFER